MPQVRFPRSLLAHSWFLSMRPHSEQLRLLPCTNIHEDSKLQVLPLTNKGGARLGCGTPGISQAFGWVGIIPDWHLTRRLVRTPDSEPLTRYCSWIPDLQKIPDSYYIFFVLPNLPWFLYILIAIFWYEYNTSSCAWGSFLGVLVRALRIKLRAPTCKAYKLQAYELSSTKYFLAGVLNSWHYHS